MVDSLEIVVLAEVVVVAEVVLVGTFAVVSGSLVKQLGIIK